MSSMKGSSSDKISTLRGLALISLRSSVDKLFYHPQAQPTKPGAVPRTPPEAKELAPPASAHARSARRPGVRGGPGPAALPRAKPGSGVARGPSTHCDLHLRMIYSFSVCLARIPPTVDRAGGLRRGGRCLDGARLWLSVSLLYCWWPCQLWLAMSNALA